MSHNAIGSGWRPLPGQVQDSSPPQAPSDAMAQAGGQDSAGAEPIRIHLPPAARVPPARPLALRRAQPADPNDLAAQLVRQEKFAPVLDAQGLRKAAGNPKEHLRIFGLTLHRSVGYRDILDKTGQYQDRLNASRCDLGTPVGRQQFRAQLAAAIKDLQALERSGRRYEAEFNHSRKGPIREHLASVRNELEALWTLDDEFDKATQAGALAFAQPVGLGDLMAFARQGISLGAAQRFIGSDIPTALEARQVIDQELAALTAHKPFAGKGFTAEEIRLLVGAGVGVDTALAIRAKGIPITQATVDLALQPDTQDGAMAKLGSGAFNSTATVKVRNQAEPLVFKPVADSERGWVAYMIGIDLDRPRIAQRNLATCAIAGQLGFDVVARTKLGHGSPPPPPDNAPPVLGLVMEKAAGPSGAKTPTAAFADPQFRQQLLRLQLLDHLVAQGDRHNNNYFVQQMADGTWRVRGIDNDQCLGHRIVNPSDIRYENTPQREGFRGTRLPPVVDQETAAQFMALAADDLRHILEPLGFSEAEMGAAQQRLGRIQGHLEILRAAGLIVTMDNLSRPPYGNQFQPANSYIGRDAIKAAY